MSVRQKDHVSLGPWQYAEAERLIRGDESGRRRRARRGGAGIKVEAVPIEAGNVEKVDLRREAETTTLHRREQILVRAYVTYLEKRGRSVARRKISVGDGGTALYCDVFEDDRRNLVEAKAMATRAAVRMAVGQLADYGRFCGDGVHRAVLLPAKPSPDLERLLSSQDLGVVWAAGQEFEDNRGGAFT